MSISRVYRLLRLITLLQGRKSYSPEELARELEVSRRTVFRDLNMLEMAHIPYYYDSQAGGYRISKHFFLPPINLTLSEALAVLLLTGRTRGAKNLPLLSQGARAAVKVESALPAPVRRHVGSIIDRLTVALGPVSRHAGLDDLFDRLAGAIAERRACRMAYISFHERKQIVTTVRPLRLVFFAQAWYLIAYSSAHKEVRTFKLARVKSLSVTARTFPDVDGEAALEDYFGDAWRMIPEGRLYKVHLHFSRMVAGNVAEVQWHRSQRVEWNDDGSAEFFATVDGLGEIAWWIMGYGDQVEVISPAPLRKRLADTAGRVVGLYRTEGT